MENMNIQLPLEAQFTLKKVELAAENMTMEELKATVVNLTWQRILERAAIVEVLKEENINIAFDMPTNDELEEILEMAEDMDDGADPFDFFTA
jgi:hypothetical protein